jgi:hypothetical protein
MYGRKEFEKILFDAANIAGGRYDGGCDSVSWQL